MEIKCSCARHSKAVGYIRATLAKAIEADEKPGLSELLLSLIEQIAKAVGHISLDDAYKINRVFHERFGLAGAASQTMDSNGRTIFVADAHRDDGKRFVVHADEKLTAFVELESMIRAATS